MDAARLPADDGRRMTRRLALAALALCLVVLAVGFVRQRLQIAEQQKEIEMLRVRVETQHKQIWRDGLYVPWLEGRLAAHEKGTPAQWRDSVMRREAARVQAESDRNRANFAGGGGGSR